MGEEAEESKTKEVKLDADGNIIASEDEDEKGGDDDDEKDKDDDDDDDDDVDVDEEEQETPDAIKSNNAYIQFYRNFNPSLKLGIMKDEPNKNRLAKLLRYKTSK